MTKLPAYRQVFTRYLKLLLISTLIVVEIFNFAGVRNSMALDLNNSDEIAKEIEKLSKDLKSSQDATVPLEQKLKSLNGQIVSIQTKINKFTSDIAKAEKQIIQKEADLDKQKKILALTVRNYYIKTFVDTPLLTLLSSDSATDVARELTFRAKTTDRDKNLIISITGDITGLKRDKEDLAKEKIKLAGLQASLNKEADFYKKEVTGAKAFQANLSGQIATLSARQNEIISARSGGFTVNIGDSELAGDYNASIKGFRESAPGGYFGVFSFGAYTHRNGMSQYGALGHVKNQSWSYEQLLKHYYPGVSISDVDINKTITVNGTNSYGQSFNNESFNFEDYLKHIYEVPSSWPAEILKAQAIAARSYAFGKSSICPSQSCQEFKREENSDAWKAAVKATEGKIMTGGPGNWQYSSTTGGWINGLGWDTTDGQGGSNFVDKSLEKIAGSPWVYKAWYTETYRNNSDKCGRTNAWLSPEEMADIVNAAIALKSDGLETGRITPVTTSCWGGNPYSMDELKNLVSGKGGISSANNISVSQGNGTTNNVTINGVSLSGAEFKKAFNLRAPGRLSIPQNGFAFFNIEKK